MNLASLQCQLHDSDRRRIELINLLLSFKHWFSHSGLQSPEAHALIGKAVGRLRNHAFTVVNVGEFSRGKTELINALLFDHFHCRILPSRPGRTTMCPTEIGYNPNLPTNSIQLLPISTRKGGISVRAFKCIPEHWVNLQFDINSPASVQDALGRLADRQFVSEEQARSLGFNCCQLNRHPQNINEVEIPVWRYAQINIDHPLLAKGLRLIDTPGLNAMGTEPELTLNTLSQADSVLFCLAADAPVSATDKAIWRDYINTEDNSRSLVIINKIDSLWDDLVSSPSDDSTTNSVRTDTALALGLPLQQVLTLSAKKALLAKARGDQALMQKSHFERFESVLAYQLNDRIKQLFKHPDVEDALVLIRQTHRQTQQRLLAQAETIQALKATDEDTLAETVTKLRTQLKEQHRRVHQESILNRSCERDLKHRYEAMLAVFSQKQLDRVLSYFASAASDPEPMLRPAIKASLKQIQLNLGKLSIEVEQTNQMLRDVYIEPRVGERMRLTSRSLNMQSRQQQYLDFKHRCEQFLNSVEHSAGADRVLIRHFLLNISQEVKLYFAETNDVLARWYENALTPLSYPNECAKQLLQKELLVHSKIEQQSRAKQQSLVAFRAELTENEDHVYTLSQLLERVEGLERSGRSMSDKVIPLSFARRKSS